jgi:hypothetical protein
MGEYVGDEKGMEIGYRQFCTKLFAEQERLWFVNLLDYYGEIEKKSPEDRKSIMIALRELLTHLKHRTRIQADDPFLESDKW